MVVENLRIAKIILEYENINIEIAFMEIIVYKKKLFNVNPNPYNNNKATFFGN